MAIKMPAENEDPYICHMFYHTINVQGISLTVGLLAVLVASLSTADLVTVSVVI